MNKFLIITPFYNVEKWIANTIKSVKAQTYTNFRHILVDDMSTDSTTEVVKSLIADDDRFVLVENREKKYALKNIQDAFERFCEDPEEIIVSLDGDDWLASPRSLEIVNDCYNQTGCLITYGSYKEYPSGHRGKFSRKVSEQTQKERSFRKAPWTTSHLRSYKYKLWEKIDKRDFLDFDGKHYKKTCDLALMYPMLEMAGNRVEFIEEMIYVYNTLNDLNDHKTGHEEQLRIERRIRSLEAYEVLHDL